MSDPEIQSANELPLPMLGGGGDLISAEDGTSESVQAFRDQQTARIRQLVEERSGLARRTKEIRIALGKETADLQATYAHPGDGDFIKRIESAGLPIATAYRYLGLYKKSLSIEKDSSRGTAPPENGNESGAGTEKGSAEACDVGENSGIETPQPVHFRKPRRQGYVDLAELEARREETREALPSLEVIKLEYTAEELLSFQVCTQQLSKRFETTNKSKIVLWALQRVCAQYGYENVATEN
jgi:hypothetical protein